MSSSQFIVRRIAPKLFLLCAVMGLLLTTPPWAQGQKLTTLYSFKGGADGGSPYFGDLVLDAKGNLYGTTLAGGVAPGLGVVFEVTPAGKEKVLHAFNSADGCSPYAGLILDATGNLYGTTGACGGYGYGTVFEITKKGTEKVLYSFTGGADGGQPFAALVRDTEGNLYGTTNVGGILGSYCCGTVFEVAPSGSETVLHAFAGGADGEYPVAALVRDAKGNLYSTTGQNGAYCCGTVFELTPSDTENILFNFNYTDGTGPGPNRLVRDAKGNLYGTTSGGGASGNGTVFELTKEGTETVLYSFTGAADGFAPYGGAIRDAKGNLYGTTFQGAGQGCNTDGCGTIYELTAAGKFTVLYTFTGGLDGGNPAGGLVMDEQGNLYGTTSGYGAHGWGTVYKLTR
ncbi:MAG: choice-of-anchor tandem repeat GloVer-containing protein [Terriglobales bacterium]